MVALVSRSETGKLKLQYSNGKEKRVALWEPFSTGVIETLFDEQGAVLKQEMLPQSGGTAENYMEKFMGEANIGEVSDEKYTEVRLAKRCPECNNDSLSRISETGKEKPEVPIMPTYLCKSCGCKSYYLSDAYLEYLVSNNTMLFSDKERGEMSADKAAFMAELKEYIIRIFASKRIIRIK